MVMDVTERPVWDLFIRFFHWSLVFGVTGAWLSATYHYMNVHYWFGCFLSSLIVCRIVWGVVGSPYARFSSFAFSPSIAIRYLISMLKNRPAYFIGHNPAGAMMVYVLLGVLLMLLTSGLITQGVIDYEGPLLMMSHAITDVVAYRIQFIHKWIGDYVWILITIHVMGVFISSIQHKENLVMAMITGIKKRK